MHNAPLPTVPDIISFFTFAIAMVGFAIGLFVVLFIGVLARAFFVSTYEHARGFWYAWMTVEAIAVLYIGWWVVIGHGSTNRPDDSVVMAFAALIPMLLVFLGDQIQSLGETEGASRDV